jgi:beta-glucanase (GH16 family)
VDRRAIYPYPRVFSSSDLVFNDDFSGITASNVSVDNGLTLSTTKQSVTANGTTYPYTSGAVSSCGGFEFDSGYLQISMELPSGDGAWWVAAGPRRRSSGDN